MGLITAVVPSDPRRLPCRSQSSESAVEAVKLSLTFTWMS